MINNDFILIICKLLEITPPTISNDDTHQFSSKTRMAEIDLESNILYIKEFKRDFDTLFSIAHELRHLWQYNTDPEFYFADYKPSDELGIEEYNQQPAEIDAHAFAALVMEYMFAAYATWRSFSHETCEMIFDRMEEIEKVISFVDAPVPK